MELIVFSGIQGAGKSTFFHERFSNSHLRLSLDLVGTRNREDILLFACLAAQQKVVLDNTSPTAAQRARYATLGKAAGFQTMLYFFNVELEEALKRNAQRPASQCIPEIGVRGTFAKLERPVTAAPFDSAFFVTPTGDRGWTVEPIK